MAVVVIDMERISSQKLGANLKFESKFEVQQSNQETEKFTAEGQETSLLNEIIVATSENNSKSSSHSEAIDFRLCSPPIGNFLFWFFLNLKFESKFEVQQSKQETEKFQIEGQETSLLNEIIVGTSENNSKSVSNSEAIDFRLCSPPIGNFLFWFLIAGIL